MQLFGFDTDMNELVFLFWLIKVTLFVFDKSILKYGGTFLFLLSKYTCRLGMGDCDSFAVELF